MKMKFCLSFEDRLTVIALVEVKVDLAVFDATLLEKVITYVFKTTYSFKVM
jgi:hypothetical protein